MNLIGVAMKMTNALPTMAHGLRRDLATRDLRKKESDHI
jgi:hypothetical protein